VQRRRFAVWAAAALGCTWPSASTPAERIHIVARKFAFEPEEVRVRQGDRVTLVLTGVDFTHGFALPDFGLRRDVVPGRDVELSFIADKAGRFHMLCDNFCGEGHDRMSGWLVVTT
jgi:cytochrome c oxidase subunit II